MAGDRQIQRVTADMGATTGVTAGLLVLFRAIDTMSGVQVALNLPVGVQEIVLALWLIWKGFNTTVPAPLMAEWRPRAR